MSEISEAELVPTPAAQPRSCSHCKYIYQTEVTHALTRAYECHRHPPQVQAIAQQGQLLMIGQFPPVQLGMWCGDYEA